MIQDLRRMIVTQTPQIPMETPVTRNLHQEDLAKKFKVDTAPNWRSLVVMI
jgi:hypothetical protein